MKNTSMKNTYDMTGHGSMYTYIYTKDFYERKPIIDSNSIGMADLWMIPVVNFDVGNLKGKKIESAVLTLKPQTDYWPVEVDVTSISQDWNSQYASNYAADKDRAWAENGWFTDVVLGNGNSVYFRERTEYDEASGLLSININPQLVYMMINGQSSGLGLLDCKSKGYATSPEDGWYLEKWLAVKRFNINPADGPIPQLEVEFAEESWITPSRVSGLKAAPLDNEEVLDSTAVLLNWSYNAALDDDYGYFQVFMSEKKLPIDQMDAVPKYFVPNLDPMASMVSTENTGLKYDTVYWFAVVCANNGCKSQPVYTSVKTLPYMRKPLPSIESTSIEPVLSRVEAEGFTVYIADEITKFDPVGGTIIGKADVSADDYRTVLFDGKRVKLFCNAGEKACFQLIVRNDTKKAAQYGIRVMNNRIKGNVLLNKSWYVKEQELWCPEVAIPVENDSFSVPFETNAIEGQQYQAIYLDIELDERIESGLSGFDIELVLEGKKLMIPVDVEVAGISLVKPPFILELNGYSGTFDYLKSLYPDKDIRDIEKEYYIAGYRHDQTVNIVPYTHGGVVYPGFFPKIEMIDGLPKVTDWSEWDGHFAKYLDGSYVLELEGKKVPITHIYLPIHENWPMPLKQYYTVNVESRDYPQLINEHKLKTTGIGNEFLPAYREGIKSVLKDFIRHIDEKGWQNVTFQYFFNNKHFYKECKPEKGLKGEATSWWLLDEPVFREDWEALAFFGSILKEAQQETGSGYNIKFRADLSCYNQMFDSLEGILDIAILNGRIFAAREDIARNRKKIYGEEYWVYGGWNKISQSNMISVLWIIDAYLKGGTGLIPWNNYGSEQNFEKPSDIAAFYPGRRFGYAGPLVSFRMKAGRKGMEMIKYLETYKKTFGYSDAQMKEIVGNFLKLRSHSKIGFDFDAGRLEYSDNSYEKLEALKQFIINELKEGLV